MTKARNIANLASDGSALADGTINYTDITGTPAPFDPATLAAVAVSGAYADVSGTPAAALPLAGGTLTGDVNFGDNVKANFGAGGDLQIYHNETDSIIEDVGTGDLKLRGSNEVKIQVRDSAGNSWLNALVATDAGATQLNYNNSGKIATTATGVTVTGTVAATSYTGSGAALTGIVSIPSGLISMWHGLVANIPSGWALCDGTAGTPNLVGQFIKGGSTAGTTGGSNTHTHTNTLSAAAHTLTTAQMPSHSHTFDTYQSNFDTANSGAGSGNPNYRNLRSVSSTGGGGSHSHTMSGSIGTASTEPAYYTLCFIMKT